MIIVMMLCLFSFVYLSVLDSVIFEEKKKEKKKKKKQNKKKQRKKKRKEDVPLVEFIYLVFTRTHARRELP